MNCLVWNCCGLRNLHTRKELREIIRAKDPSIVFIAETLASKVRLDMIQQNIDFEHKWVVPRVGHGGFFFLEVLSQLGGDRFIQILY